MFEGVFTPTVLGILGAIMYLRLGYIVLPKDVSAVGHHIADWSEQDLEEADRVASRVVEAIRAGKFSEIGGYSPFDPVLRAICGLDLIAPPALKEAP